MFDEKLKAVQDYEMWFRMINAGYELFFLPIVSGATRFHDTQVSILKQDLCNREHLYGFSKILDSIEIELIKIPKMSVSSTFYILALEYKKRNRIGLYEYSLKRGDEYLKNNSNDKNRIDRVYRFRAVFWIKYISLSFWWKKYIGLKRRLKNIRKMKDKNEN